MAREELSTEIVNRGVEPSGPDAGSPTFSVRVRRRLPDFLQSVNLKYVRLGYHYLLSHGVYLATIPVIVLVCGAEVGSLSRDELWRKVWDEATYDLATVLAFLAVLAFTISVYIMSRPRPIYLIDFATYKPADELKVSKAEFIELARKSGKFDEESLAFQARLLAKSGIGDESYMPRCVFQPDANCATMKEGRAEASAAMFAALDELFDKCRVRPKDVGVLVVNCSLFNPTPSLSAMIVNHYKMRGNILSYNLGGMGCSAGVISIDLARDMLQASGAGLAVVVSTEAVSFTWYAGKRRSMLIPNAFFRAGAAAVLLSNRRRDFRRAKYQLEHVVRTHKGADDRAFRSVYQEEDEQRIKGLSISRDLVEVGGHALKTNITTLGPLVLPFSEQLLFFAGVLFRHLYPSKTSTPPPPAANGDTSAAAPYIPDFKRAFEHFCMHAASRDVLEHLQRNLGLRDADLEASRAVRRVRRPSRSPWLDCVDQYPARMDA
ncbi:unnamed protein product [Triticum turgidum subsp. durum]|uniref:3-ketoacyl-CoA synthase n=1 Tax=Triticum turgidum subsp. durum TaxID=4567 RepID=A0A9R0VTT7_TRITD|nr:unnamed protein product [Triticum turgidum subsp. durum]